MRVAAIVIVLAGCDALFRVDAVSVIDANDAVRSNADARTGPRVVFVTAGVYTSALGGLAQADMHCQMEANHDPVRTPGVYRAWLSTASMSPALVMNQGGGPFMLSDGMTMVATNWSSLTTADLMNAIEMEPDGTIAPGDLCGVWTNTSSSGFPAGAMDCSDWTIAQGMVPAGYSHATMSIWSNNTNDCPAGAPCGGAGRLYCFQQ